jgi:hypothetical protein
LLEDRYKEQITELMKIQTREYIGFIKTFVESTNIMTKSFFVVVPYSPSAITSGNNPISNLTKSFRGNKAEQNKSMGKDGTMPNDQFEEYRSQLEQRVGVVEQGLVRCGVRVAELGTEEVVELFYKIFNPGETEKPIQIN